MHATEWRRRLSLCMRCAPGRREQRRRTRRLGERQAPRARCERGAWALAAPARPRTDAGPEKHLRRLPQQTAQTGRRVQHGNIGNPCHLPRRVSCSFTLIIHLYVPALLKKLPFFINSFFLTSLSIVITYLTQAYTMKHIAHAKHTTSKGLDI